MTKQDWIDRFVAELTGIGCRQDVALIEAAAAWEDEGQRAEEPEDAARTMLTYAAECVE